MLRSLFIGFGKAGRDLHLPCVRKAQSRCQPESLFHEIVGVVDPRIPALGANPDNRVQYFAHLEHVTDFPPEETVVHICTPPIEHLPALRQLAARGYTRVIVEKPLATSTTELREIAALQVAHRLDILVVANWLASTLTARIKEIVDTKRFGPLQRMVLEQHKPRFSRTLTNPAHTSAFDIEIPHQVALALYLAGQTARVISAASDTMHVSGTEFPHLGGARLTLSHEGGVQSLVDSDLTAPIRRRSVTLFFPEHSLVGHYPTGSDDHFSRLSVYDGQGTLIDSTILADDPLTACFVEFYRYFKHGSPRPVSDLPFNDDIVTLISTAKALCGIDVYPAVSLLSQR